MRRQSAELKRIARGNLLCNFAVPMGTMVVSNLMQSIPLLFFSRNLTEYSPIGEWVIYYLASFIISLLGVVLSVGTMRIALQIARKKEYRFSDLFYGFKHHPDKYMLTQLLIMLITLIPMLPGIGAYVIFYFTDSVSILIVGMLLLIAGCVVSVMITLKYELALVLLLDCEQMTIREAMRESSRLMKGNRGRFFYITLSFIGLWILGIVSFGVGFLWITPYVMQTKTVFYLERIGEYDNNISCYEQVSEE